VLDHCLALSAGPALEATVAKVEALARFPNLHAKLTFLPTGSAEAYPFRDLHGACRRFVAAYGPQRCVWGSDYPTELWCPKTTYAGHLDLFRQELGLSPGEQEAILGETAARLYRL
jgi:L-fuconolactonase